jgi:HAD superfamily hydrolase (TIGR01549 family)
LTETERAVANSKFFAGECGAFIFDFDGTLYNARFMAPRLVAAMPFDIPLIRAERRTRKLFRGRDFGNAASYWDAFFEEMASSLYGGDARRKKNVDLRAWYFERYIPTMTDVLRRHYSARKGAAELFGGVLGGARGTPFAIYSDYPQTSERLRAIGLDIPNELVYGPENFGAQKPAPRPFLSIAQAIGGALGCAASRVCVVGDKDETDGEGAAAAGMRFFKISCDADWDGFVREVGVLRG